MNVKIARALLSVSDKTGLAELGRALAAVLLFTGYKLAQPSLWRAAVTSRGIPAPSGRNESSKSNAA